MPPNLSKKGINSDYPNNPTNIIKMQSLIICGQVPITMVLKECDCRKFTGELLQEVKMIAELIT